MERELVRRFALEVQDTALAEHLMIAGPIWPTPSVSRNVSGIFHSGYGDTLGLLHQPEWADSVRDRVQESCRRA